MKQLQLADIGAVLILVVHDEDGTIVNLATATTLTIKLEPPSGTLKTRTAGLYTNGTDGKMSYTTVAGDINETGQWNIQGYIVFSSSRKFSTTVRNFSVLSNL